MDRFLTRSQKETIKWITISPTTINILQLNFLMKLMTESMIGLRQA
jgi:hypothetical protein